MKYWCTHYFVFTFVSFCFTCYPETIRSMHSIEILCFCFLSVVRTYIDFIVRLEEVCFQVVLRITPWNTVEKKNLSLRQHFNSITDIVVGTQVELPHEHRFLDIILHGSRSKSGCRRGNSSFVDIKFCIKFDSNAVSKKETSFEFRYLFWGTV